MRAAAASTARGRSVIGVLLAAFVLALVPTATPASADAGLEAEFVALVNRERAAAGLPSLSVASDLVGVARKHSVRMADQSNLHHNPSLSSHVSGWQKVGENVGRGPSVSSIHSAFMDSPGHRRNVLDADWTQVGIGVEVRGSTIWVTAVFRLPAGAAPKPEKAPEPAPAPAPEPETKPAPKPAPAPDPQPAASPATSAPASSPAAPADDAADTPAAPAAPEAPTEPLPPHLDRVVVTLARLDAAEGHGSLDELLD